MGNVLKAIQKSAQAVVGGVTDCKQEVQLLQELQELPQVELWRVHWCLSQDLLQEVPPIPPSWLHSADAGATAKAMIRCYQEDGAQMVWAAVLNLIGQDDQARPFHRTANPQRPRLAQKPGPDFVQTHRPRLITRIQRPDTILDTLLGHGVLTASNRDAISIYAICRDKSRALVDLVLRKGGGAQELFYQALSQSEPFLLQELEDEPIREKNASETSAVLKMLEFLVSDELKSFQWLVSDHMTGESRPPTGGKQLHHADQLTTLKLLEKHLGSKQAESVATEVVLKVVPTLHVCQRGEPVTSQNSCDIRVETSTAQVELTPEVHEDGNMFRLRCQQPGVFCCGLTGLRLEGWGDVVYEMVPWDLNFLSSKGLQPAGHLFRFTLLKGGFQRLHLPHSELLSGSTHHHLSVVHVTGDSVDFITPGQVTDSHVTVNISGFSCFGLVMPAASSGAISGLVLLFLQPTNRSLFVLLQPRNICLTQVQKEWKRRIGAEYVETIPDCELIPNQMYKLIGEPGMFIQPQISKFVNFSDYNNSFFASFEVKLPVDITEVGLQLRSHVTPHRLIGWLFGATECEVWTRVIQLRGSARVPDSGLVDTTVQLLWILNHLSSEDMRTFQRLLSLHSDPIPVSRLEAADRTRTVDLMVQQYHAEGAREVTKEILKKMSYNLLAEELKKT